MGVVDTVKKGYTEPDYSLRCKFCSIGVDSTGGNVGGLISQYIVACETPDGTVAVARIARCINMGGFRPDNSKRPACEKIQPEYFKALPAMTKYGLTKEKILACCEKSRSYLFTLKELRQGWVGERELPGRNTTPPPDHNESAERASDNFEEVF